MPAVLLLQKHRRHEQHYIVSEKELEESIQHLLILWPTRILKKSLLLHGISHQGAKRFFTMTFTMIGKLVGQYFQWSSHASLQEGKVHSPLY